MTRLAGAAAIVVATLLLAFPSVAGADVDRRATVGTTREAWYVTPAACRSPVGCPVPSQQETNPDDTLHVGMTAGTQDAATYVELDTSAIPGNARITHGTLTMPVRSDTSVMPEQAELLVCAVIGAFQPDGPTSKPPEHDCQAASAPASYIPGPTPVFEVDLASFLGGATSQLPALAILPGPTPDDTHASWRVTLWGKDHESPDAVPITAELAYVSPAGTATSGGVEFPPPASDTGTYDVAPSIPDDPPQDLVAPPLRRSANEPLEPPAPNVAPEADGPQAADPAAPLALTGYPYRGAWLVPLLVLIGYLLAGRVLTRPMNVPGRHGFP